MHFFLCFFFFFQAEDGIRDAQESRGLGDVYKRQVMYATLSFDAHAILGVENTAELPEIKRAYRALSKKYHPDINGTDAARVIYTRVRKAYEKLIKGDDVLEEDFSQEEMRVGIAMPSWMVSKDNQGFVLVLMLSIVFGIPLLMYLKFRDKDKVNALINSVKDQAEHIPKFLDQLGVPRDGKYEEKRVSRTDTMVMLKKLGLVPPQVPETALVGFPLLPEFIARCVAPEKYMQLFKSLGFQEPAVQVLHNYAVDNADSIIDAYELHLKVALGRDAVENPMELPKINGGTYRTIKHMMIMYTDGVAKDIDELQAAMPGELRSIRKIVTIHREMYELLANCFEREPVNPKHIQSLTTIVRQLDEATEEIIPDAQKVMQKYRKQYYEQQVGKKTLKRMEKAARRGPANGPQQ
eukprot:TRINITY_DN28266_c0_g1_i1.p1 TRINITY_DN28266_c0_g1~~TRINITY_DN28266_c0_g1_i1.p1  ORF type:complete len:409 (-),score=148.06 TRINITY_DN28266_c0_g1_i1:252-1478(-)